MARKIITFEEVQTYHHSLLVDSEISEDELKQRISGFANMYGMSFDDAPSMLAGSGVTIIEVREDGSPNVRIEEFDLLDEDEFEGEDDED